MKYSLYIDQLVLAHWQGKIDAADCFLIAFISDLDQNNPEIKKYMKDGYFLIIRKWVIEHLPILNIAEKAIERRLHHLVKLRILDSKHMRSEAGTFLGYYKLSGYFYKISNKIHIEADKLANSTRDFEVPGTQDNQGLLSPQPGTLKSPNESITRKLEGKARAGEGAQTRMCTRAQENPPLLASGQERTGKDVEVEVAAAGPTELPAVEQDSELLFETRLQKLLGSWSGWEAWYEKNCIELYRKKAADGENVIMRTLEIYLEKKGPGKLAFFIDDYDGYKAKVRREDDHHKAEAQRCERSGNRHIEEMRSQREQKELTFEQGKIECQVMHDELLSIGVKLITPPAGQGSQKGDISGYLDTTCLQDVPHKRSSEDKSGVPEPELATVDIF